MISEQTFLIKTDQEDRLDESLKRMWELDNAGMSEEKEFTGEDRNAVEKVQGSVKYLGDRYEIGIPWKNNSRPQEQLRSCSCKITQFGEKPEENSRSWRKVFKDNQ